jgi:hypothetical protein
MPITAGHELRLTYGTPQDLGTQHEHLGGERAVEMKAHRTDLAQESRSRQQYRRSIAVASVDVEDRHAI